MSMTVCLFSCRVTNKVTDDSWRWTTTSTRQAGDHSRCFPSPTISPVPEQYEELWQCWAACPVTTIELWSQHLYASALFTCSYSPQPLVQYRLFVSSHVFV